MEKKNEINGDLKSLILIMSAGAGGGDRGNAKSLKDCLGCKQIRNSHCSDQTSHI